MPIVVSGMRPTGKLQLGNLLGALSTWVDLQGEGAQCFFFVADWHALTTGYENPEQIQDNIREMVIDWLAAGLDPDKVVIFRQSDILEHAELHLLFSMLTPLAWLQRCPTYKDQLRELKDRDLATYGFLGYPNLMAADILIYKAELVPVGEDQLPHLELAREIARRFNHLYQQSVFPEPQARLNKVTLLPGIDGRKMSKSYGNFITMSGDPQEIQEKVRIMLTDPQRARRHDPGDPNVCTVFTFHKIYSPPAELEELTTGCRTAGIGCVDCKKRLIARMTEAMADIYTRRKYWEGKPEAIAEILAAGATRARTHAQATMAEVRSAMRLR